MIRIQGVEKLHGAEHTIIADRIEAGTFVIAGAITGGDVAVTGCVPEHLGALVAKLRQAGVDIDAARRDARCACGRPGGCRSVDMTTEEYPGFATDLQAQYMALMTQAEGIADHRGAHLREPLHARAGTGAHGREHPRWTARQAIVAGPRAADRRGGDRLATCAPARRWCWRRWWRSGETVIDRVYHIDRGYEKIEAKLARVGAQHPARGVDHGNDRTAHHTPGFLALVNDAKTRVRQIDIEAYQEMREPGDAAPAGRRARGQRVGRRPRRRRHAPGQGHHRARHRERRCPDKDTPMVLYCGGGFRSALAADNLQKMGYADVISLDGGWRAWQAAGLPVEKPESPKQ